MTFSPNKVRGVLVLSPLHVGSILISTVVVILQGMYVSHITQGDAVFGSYSIFLEKQEPAPSKERASI